MNPQNGKLFTEAEAAVLRDIMRNRREEERKPQQALVFYNSY